MRFLLLAVFAAAGLLLVGCTPKPVDQLTPPGSVDRHPNRPGVHKEGERNPTYMKPPFTAAGPRKSRSR
ncbi:MAG: hypothetical protein WC712_13480 [Candidatus Brocadiia bacterium]